VVIYRCRNFSFITFSLSSKFFLLAWLPLILTSSFSLFLSSSGLVPPAWSPQLKKQKKKEKEKHRAKKHKKEKKVVVPGTDLFSLNARLLCKTISDIVSLIFSQKKKNKKHKHKGKRKKRVEESNSSSDDTDSNSEDENRVVSTSELLQRSELIFPII